MRNTGRCVISHTVAQQYLSSILYCTHPDSLARCSLFQRKAGWPCFEPLQACVYERENLQANPKTTCSSSAVAAGRVQCLRDICISKSVGFPSKTLLCVFVLGCGMVDGRTPRSHKVCEQKKPVWSPALSSVGRFTMKEVSV